MLRKLNQKQETFCLKYFKLGNATEAAILAGYNPKYAATHTTRWLKMANISERLAELNKAAKDETIAEVIERKRILTEIIRARMSDFVKVGADGIRISIDPDNANCAALREVRSWAKCNDNGTRKVVTIIKLRDPIQAIAELNKMEHIYEPEGSVTIDNRSVTINVNSEKARSLTQRLIKGERVGGDSK